MYGIGKKRGFPQNPLPPLSPPEGIKGRKGCKLVLMKLVLVNTGNGE